MSTLEEDLARHRLRRQFVAEGRATDMARSPAAIRQSLAAKHAALSAARPIPIAAQPLRRVTGPTPVRGSAVDAAELVLGDDLNKLTNAAVRRLGMQPAAGGRASVERPAVPQTYRPLAGLEQNKRGQTVRVDSTRFNEAVSADNPYGYFPHTTIVEARSPGDDAEMVAVVLGFQLSRPFVAGEFAITGFDTRVTATLQWGLGGAEFEVEYDWINGNIVSVPANYVRVIANVPDNSANAGLDAPLFILSAGVAYGAPPAHKNRARLTVPLTSLTSSEDVWIPDFAIGVNVLGASVPITILQQDSGQTGDISYSHTYVAGTNLGGQDAGFFPIGNGADLITVTNLSGAALAGYSLLFDLAL